MSKECLFHAQFTIKYHDFTVEFCFSKDDLGRILDIRQLKNMVF